MLAGLAPARRRLLLVVVALAVVAVTVLVVVLVSRSAEAPAVEAAPDKRPGPVVLVPGYGGGPDALQDLADRLIDEGRDATVVDFPDRNTGDLTASADVLGEAVDDALARTGEDSVDVVGYSAGGIVTRLWLAEGGAAVARRVVTLGSPHHGSTTADYGTAIDDPSCTLACRQMATDSDVITRLNAEAEVPAGVSFVSIWTTQDETVTPPDSARLEGALNMTVQSVCPDARVTHEDLPYVDPVPAMVVAELMSDDPVPFGPDDCTRLGG
ncbi:lipase [Blastococcus sp. CT_GayMR20]|uniref:esterase/lipase family protein n=1 Tax=Blastococcus sp. CT_GayMR20 TaxID=2559609 RepID=UPI001072FFCF|nr:lipase [Blastococcus sp. CT_GayMR20]TFV69181.1 lipase [Blastococcus sp. CT_GayMR20]